MKKKNSTIDKNTKRIQFVLLDDNEEESSADVSSIKNRKVESTSNINNATNNKTPVDTNNNADNDESQSLNTENDSELSDEEAKKREAREKFLTFVPDIQNNYDNGVCYKLVNIFKKIQASVNGKQYIQVQNNKDDIEQYLIEIKNGLSNLTDVENIINKENITEINLINDYNDKIEFITNKKKEYISKT